MADEPGQEPGGQGTQERIASLEAGQSSLESKVDKILGIVSGGGQEAGAGEQPAGGATVADEIRAQLDARDAKAAADAEAKSAGDRVAAVEARIAELSEKPPAPMPRRIERIMGWR